MLSKPILITVLELTQEEIDRQKEAQILGIPEPVVFGHPVDMYFYTIDGLMELPGNSDQTLIFSGGQEFVTNAKIIDIVEAISRAK